MGLRGPQPGSPEEKRAKGETRPSRVNHNAPEVPDVESIAPPKGLAGVGLQEWKRVAPLLKQSGVLKQTDMMALEDYCRALSDLRGYEAIAKKVGRDMAIMKGYAKQIKDLRGQTMQLRRELGLSPSSRSVVKVPKTSASGDGKTDKVRKYLVGIPGGRS